MREGIPEYDRRALAEIRQWKTPELSWFGQAMRAVDWPLAKASDWLLEQPLVGEAIRTAISGVVGVCNDAAQWSVRQEAICDEFRRAGHALETPTDLTSLRLEDIDRVVGFLDAKYKGLAAAEGAATGVAGLPGIVVGLPALVMLNLRAIGEYATYYGLDVTVQHESVVDDMLPRHLEVKVPQTDNSWGPGSNPERALRPAQRRAARSPSRAAVQAVSVGLVAGTEDLR